MIRYTLSCAEGHRFDSWFQSAEAYDTLASRALVSCAVCGSSRVGKAPMAPAVATRDTAPLTATASPQEQAIEELRRRIEAESDYVGLSFAAEARAIHAGEAPERAIYGEARRDEAIRLIEEGIPVAPLPFTPRRKTQ